MFLTKTSSEKRIHFFTHLAHRLQGHQYTQVDQQELTEMLPAFWREEANSREEWFIRTCRGFGLHATYRVGRDEFIVTRTRSAAHEATITWPGKAQS